MLLWLVSRAQVRFQPLVTGRTDPCLSVLTMTSLIGYIAASHFAPTPIVEVKSTTELPCQPLTSIQSLHRNRCLDTSTRLVGSWPFCQQLPRNDRRRPNQPSQ